jgi:hypothetical protein
MKFRQNLDRIQTEFSVIAKYTFGNMYRRSPGFLFIWCFPERCVFYNAMVCVLWCDHQLQRPRIFWWFPWAGPNETPASQAATRKQPFLGFTTLAKLYQYDSSSTCWSGKKYLTCIGNVSLRASNSPRGAFHSLAKKTFKHMDVKIVELSIYQSIKSRMFLADTGI